MKYFVVADVHSFYDAMIKALEDKGFDKSNPEHHVIVCGDLFDRGPDTKKCYEFAVEMAGTDRFTYICGNHEDLLIQCVNDMVLKHQVGDHHIHNGTLDTIAQFTGRNKLDLLMGMFNDDELYNELRPLLGFICDNVVDCAELDDYVLVHGWIPCEKKRVDVYTDKYVVVDDWRNGDWDAARWVNGIEAAHQGVILPNKTIVCGHFHCSYGWSRIKQERKEFPSKCRMNWEKSFEIYENRGIIALDACTVFSGFVNCYVIER